MQFDRDGAQHHPAALGPEPLARLEAILEGIPADRAGTRLHALPGLVDLLAASGTIGRIAARHIGGVSAPVRAILFNKTAGTNWAIGWHQDRTVAVARRIPTPGFAPWTVKAGLTHVEPPFALLARMTTLRVHLDFVGPTNAPLLIAPGSHRAGRIAEPDIEPLAMKLGTFACLADRGDIWAYSTPILHASEAATAPAQRRVLQVDYSPDILPAPLEWLGV